MMRNYELVLVIGPDYSEEKRKAFLGEIQEKLEEFKGKVVKTEELGKKKLTYPINKKEMGYYFHWQVKLDPTQMQEVDHYLKMEEQILRFLLVSKEE